MLEVYFYHLGNRESTSPQPESIRSDLCSVDENCRCIRWDGGARGWQKAIQVGIYIIFIHSSIGIIDSGSGPAPAELGITEGVKGGEGKGVGGAFTSAENLSVSIHEQPRLAFPITFSVELWQLSCLGNEARSHNSVFTQVQSKVYCL